MKKYLFTESQIKKVIDHLIIEGTTKKKPIKPAIVKPGSKKGSQK